MKVRERTKEAVRERERTEELREFERGRRELERDEGDGVVSLDGCVK